MSKLILSVLAVPMKLTPTDAYSVRTTRKLLKMLERNLVTDAEFVNNFFYQFAFHCHSDTGIQQCVAALPERLWPQLKTKIAEKLKSAHPGEMFLIGPGSPDPSELAQSDERMRHAMAVMAKYLETPTGVIDFEVEDPTGMREKWFLFQHLETAPGERCRKPDCSEDRILRGYFAMRITSK